MSVEEMIEDVKAEEPTEETNVKKTKGKKKTVGTQASPEEQKKGVPKDGFVLLFKLVSRAEVKEFEDLKKQIGEAMVDGGHLTDERASIPRVVLHALRAYEPKAKHRKEEAA